MLKQLPLTELKLYNNLTMLYEMKTHSHTQLAGVRTILSKTKKKRNIYELLKKILMSTMNLYGIKKKSCLPLF